MFKRIMSVMLAIVMLLSVAMIATSAAQVEIADNSADAVAEVAADGAADTGADAGADTGAGNVINFKVEGSGWKNFKKVFCHIWEHGGDSFFAWQAKAEACKDEDGDGIWTYDLDAKGVTLEPGKLYAVIFSNENSMQTYDLLMDSTCIGDTVYCDLNQSFENPEDSSKTALAAFWTSKDPVAFGPVKCVTSIGNVVGTCIPATTSAQAMFVDFLVNKLENARTYSGKNDQQLLDDTGAALELKQDNVSDAIYTAGVKVDWKAENSSLPSGINEDGYVDGSGNVNTGEDTQGAKPGQGSVTEKPETAEKAESNKSNGGSSNGGSSTGGSGTANNSKTGPETTALFIMIGVMIAAAGVIVLARKERA